MKKTTTQSKQGDFMKQLFFIVSLLITLASQTQAAIAETLPIPSEQILEASRKIIPQTGPYYFVEGILHCTQIAQEVPPYKMHSICTITIGASEEFVLGEVEEIIEVLKQVKHMTGPVYSVSAKFSASSISREFPPYDIIDSAEVAF